MHLGSLREGRKAIILVSEGYTQHPAAAAARPDRRRCPASATRTRGSQRPASTTARAFFANVDIQSGPARGLQRGQPQQHDDLRRSTRAASRRSSSTSTRASTSRPTGNMLDATLDTLRVLADKTDGRAIVNRNDLESGLKQVVRDSSAYYLLGYNSSKAPAPTASSTRSRCASRGRACRCGRARATGRSAPRRRRPSTAPPKPSAPPAVTKALGIGRADAPRAVHPQLDRHLARRERQDAGDLRLGAAADGARAGPQPGDRRIADCHGHRRPAVFPGPGARGPQDVCGARASGRPGHWRTGLGGQRRQRGAVARGRARHLRRRPGAAAAAHLRAGRGGRHGRRSTPTCARSRCRT